MKNSKNWHFSKGVKSWFCSKNWPFFHLFFWGNIGQENVFYNILKRKNAFLGHKNSKLKKSKNWDFSKGVNPWFCSKIGHFSNLFFLDNISKENVFYDILVRKNAFLRNKNKKFNKSKNWHFSKGLLKNWPFFHLFLLGNMGQENVFYDILERKSAFLGNKNKKL